jgi:hypothetical protein
VIQNFPCAFESSGGWGGVWYSAWIWTGGWNTFIWRNMRKVLALSNCLWTSIALEI